MAEATLKVPGELTRDFRAALVEEIKLGQAGVTDDAIALAYYVENADRSSAREIEDAARRLAADVALLDQLAETNGSAVEIRGDSDTLHHVCADMADKVIAPKLAEEVNVSPLTGEVADKARELVAAMSWAIDNADRLHREWEAEHVNGSAA